MVPDPRNGNDYARGETNDGGAPEGNKNGVTHGMYADPKEMWEWLVENDFEWPEDV